MAIASVGATHDTSGDGTLPDGSTAADQLMIAAIVHSADSLAGLTGWTEFLQSTIDGAVMMTLFWIIRGGSPPDLTYTGGGSQYSETMLVYSGTHLTAPIGTTNIVYRASETTPDSPSIDITVPPDSWLVCGLDVIGTSGAITKPTDLTSRIAVNNSQGWADSDNPPSPSDPSGLQTWTFGTASDCHACSFEILPPEPGGARRIDPQLARQAVQRSVTR